mgnify:CR=1 FL=1
MEKAYHQAEAEQGPMVLERISDLNEAKRRLGDFLDIRGMTVVNPTGNEVGKVDSLYMDPKLDKLTMAGISFGGVWGFGAKHTLVPMDQLEVIDGNKVRVMPNPEIVNAAPDLKEDEGDYRCYCDYWTRVSRERASESKRAA